MADIKESKPSTTERPKPEKLADVVDIDSARKKRQFKEFSGDTSIEELRGLIKNPKQRLEEKQT